MLVHWCKLGLYSYDQPVELKLKFLNSSFSYTAPTTLGIRQEAEEITANVFYSTFLKFFATFFAFLTS